LRVKFSGNFILEASDIVVCCKIVTKLASEETRFQPQFTFKEIFMSIKSRVVLGSAIALFALSACNDKDKAASASAPLLPLRKAKKQSPRL
jgi:hypothetical protein